jgi:hypothetical protein
MTSYLHLPAPAKQPPPKPEPMRIAARDVPAPPLRHAILEGGTKPTPGSPAAQVQLGAFRDQAAAREGWSKIVAVSDGALQGKSPLVVSVDLPGKERLWRLRTAARDKSSARRLCAGLVAKGLACIMVKD